MKTITRVIAVMAMIIILPSCFQSKPETDEAIAQQQEFPERTLNLGKNKDSAKKTVDIKHIEKSNETTTATQARNTAPAVDSRKHESKYAERKHTSELEEEYYDVYDRDFLDNIDDEEYDDAEEFDYEDRWSITPQGMVRQRPVKPHGRYHKFNPQDF